MWHKHFKRFEFGFGFEYGFGRQLFNTHMGIYECLVSAQLESARHLAKKRVEPKRATPKNRHRNMAGRQQRQRQQRRTRKSRNCLTIIEWRGAVAPTPPTHLLFPSLSLAVPVPLSPDHSIQFPMPGFMFQVFRKRFACIFGIRKGKV